MKTKVFFLPDAEEVHMIPHKNPSNCVCNWFVICEKEMHFIKPLLEMKLYNRKNIAKCANGKTEI